MATQATPDHSPEYLSFQENFEALVSTFKAQPAAYADSLFSNGYIPDEVLEYSRLNGVINSNKSRKILDAIISGIKLNPIVFHSFIEAIAGPSTDDVVKKLHDSYERHKTATSRVEQPQLSPPPHQQPLPEAPTSFSFPHLDTSSLDEDIKIELEDRIIADTKEMITKFAAFTLIIKRSFENQRIPLEYIKDSVLSLEAFNDGIGVKVLDPEDKKEIKCAKNLSEVFMTLRDYISFFNYEIVQYLIELLGSPDDQTQLREYCSAFDQFCQRNVFEVPAEAFSSESRNKTAKVFVLKCTERVATLEYVKRLTRRIAEVFGLQRAGLQLRSVRQGCLELHFLITVAVAKRIYPVSPTVQAALSTMGVKVLTCGSTDEVETLLLEQLIQPTSSSLSTKHHLVKMASNVFEMKNLSPKERIKASHGQRQQKTTGSSHMGRRKVDPKLTRLLTVCGSGTKLQLLELLKDTHIVNQKIKGTTLLHEACYHGNMECVKTLMKAGACSTILNVRGFTPAHSAAYNNHLSSLEVLLDFNPPSTTNSAKATPNTLSKDKESLLHITCFRGHLKLAQFLVSREANLGATDCHGNSVLHSAAGSDSGVLVKWLIDQLSEDVESAVNARNKFGQTPAHRASVLGCPSSLSVLIHYAANLSIQDNDGYTPVDLARLMCKTSCYDIGCDVKKAYSLPSTPPPYSGSISKSLSSSQSLSARVGRQRSLSNASSSSTPPLLQRQPSITGAHRPRNLSIIRRASLMSKELSLTSVDDASMYVTKTTALQVASSLKHEKSRDNTQQLIYNSTAYEPPPGILFVPPVHKTTISPENPRFFSGAHDIKIRISPKHWPPQTLPPDPSKLDPTPPAQPPSIDLCVCAAMHLNQPFSPGYTIVSPVYFISCKTVRPCQVELTLPHAVAYTKDEDKKRLCILSTTTVNPNLRDVWSPSDRTLTELQTDSFEVDTYHVKFRTSLVHPSLYAVAVNERDFSLEPHLPLRCSLYISYPMLEPMASVSGLYVTSYVGMKLKTVYTAVTNQTTENKSKFEEKHFTLSGDSVRVDTGLTNQSDEWVMTSRDSGEFTYNQLALTQETDKDFYSHTPAYPPHTTFFVEPRGVVAAVRCRVKLLSGDGTEISYIQVIPFSPCRELTPPPSHLTKSYVPLPRFTLAQPDDPDTPVTNV